MTAGYDRPSGPGTSTELLRHGAGATAWEFSTSFPVASHGVRAATLDNRLIVVALGKCRIRFINKCMHSVVFY